MSIMPYPETHAEVSFSKEHDSIVFYIQDKNLIAFARRNILASVTGIEFSLSDWRGAIDIDSRLKNVFVKVALAKLTSGTFTSHPNLPRRTQIEREDILESAEAVTKAAQAWISLPQGWYGIGPHR
jgi:hypothetical protein